MKKLVLCLLIMVVISGVAFADILDFPPSLAGGNFLFDIGVAPFVFYKNELADLYSFPGTDFVNKIPPALATAEFTLPIPAPISVGAMFGFLYRSYSYGGDSLKITLMNIGGRANWHWNINVPWLDLYTGFGLGVNIYKYDETSFPSVSDTDFMYGFHAGAHFYFNRYVGAFLEAGYPYPVRIGLALKFGKPPEATPAQRAIATQAAPAAETAPAAEAAPVVQTIYVTTEAPPVQAPPTTLYTQSSPALPPPPTAVAPPPLPLKYMIASGGQPYGPYEMEQLQQAVRQGILTVNTLVWREGMTQWQPAGTIRELAGLF